ncbi:hypothetical protein RFI_12651 [Reticulomyxa filosa]|uniref:Uncharacterized protein n=1 Tax=Reticulomyxa filosa TaxID=46433 RepID=X6NEU4_RETFI|nr:hypothetical protein RFI_12651 [Reticulomyxa filosa]|eukprot:ETO24506.1 hypothetical protein RFI_12651 [Reticulomyxa filosa]
MYLYFNVKVLVKNLHEIDVKFNQRQQLSVENKKNVKDVKNPDLNRYVLLKNIAWKNKFVLNFASCKAFNNNRNNPKSHFRQCKKCFGLNYYINKNKLFVQTINLFQHKDLLYPTKINSSFENEIVLENFIVQNEFQILNSSQFNHNLEKNDLKS